MSCGTWRRISPSSELQSPSSVNKCSMVYASDLPKIWQESHLSHPSHLSYLFLSHQCPTLQWLRRHLSFGSLRLTCCRLGRASALPPSVAPHGQHLPNSGRAETRRLAWLDWKHNRKIRRNSELNSAWTIDMNHDYHWLSLIIIDYPDSNQAVANWKSQEVEEFQTLVTPVLKASVFWPILYTESTLEGTSKHTTSNHLHPLRLAISCTTNTFTRRTVVFRHNLQSLQFKLVIGRFRQHHLGRIYHNCPQGNFESLLAWLMACHGLLRLSTQLNNMLQYMTRSDPFWLECGNRSHLAVSCQVVRVVRKSAESMRVYESLRESTRVYDTRTYKSYKTIQNQRKIRKRKRSPSVPFRPGCLYEVFWCPPWRIRASSRLYPPCQHRSWGHRR